jgi:hypothetical protein
MMVSSYRVGIAMVSIALTVHVASTTLFTIEDDLLYLNRQVRMRQWNDSAAPLSLNTSTWNVALEGHEIGKFQTDVHFNFVGNPEMQLLRNAMKVSDDNMFVTSFVLEAVYEATALASDVITPDRWSVAAAVNATMGLRDRNLAADVPIFGFWPQRQMPSTYGPVVWQQWPINLAGFSEIIAGDGSLWQSLSDLLGIGSFWTKYGAQIVEYFHGLTVLFQIPSDADDSSVVMALSRAILESADAYPEAAALWSTANLNMSKAFELYDHFSYCIASNVEDKNIIDPRTYFWARPYLNNITDKEACIVVTWMQNASETMRIVTNRSAGVPIPINVNNLDPTVGANSIYAMSTSLLYNHSEWFVFSERRRKLYLQTADFVAYAVRTQQDQRRPDLELLYYPPVYNIIWFAARHVRMLNDHIALKGALPFAEMEQVRVLLTRALRDGGLGYVADTAKAGEEGCGYANSSCWDGFLGEADTDAQGNSTPHYEDRYTNTAVVALAIMDMYSVRNGTRLIWVVDVPVLAKTLVSTAVTYLRASLRNSTTKFDNAFFSGSGKYWEQYPFWYPANVRFNYRNNASVNCSGNLDDLGNEYYTTLYGASGKISDDEFAAMTKAGCYGVKAPTWFSGYNANLHVKKNQYGIEPAWPYWSSPVLSYALAMQVLAKYRSLTS